MKCVCRDCGIDYDNERDYATSICNECFKSFNENLLQPMKDKLRALEGKTFVDLEKFKARLEEAGYHQRWTKEIFVMLEERENGNV